MSTFFVDIHFSRFEIIELFPNIGFVFGRQSRPRLVGPSVVLMARGHFYVVAKFDNLETQEKSSKKFCEHVVFSFWI